MGMGIWGTTISQLLSKNSVFLWGRNNEITKEINSFNTNKKYLGDFTLSKNIIATTDDNIFYDANFIFIVIPSQTIGNVIHRLKAKINNQAKIIICSKGIEDETHLLMSEVISKILDNEILFLTGPNFAREIIRGLPSFANIAGKNPEAAQNAANIISTENFKVKVISDINGAQVSAALKNVYAILCGILSGKNLGLNCQAAVLTSALNEMKLFCELKNSSGENLLEFCGIGDLILTCCSENSRNVKFGRLIANGLDTNPKELAEGFYTLKSAYELARKHEINAKIVNSVYNIIYKRNNADTEIRLLLSNL